MEQLVALIVFHFHDVIYRFNFGVLTPFNHLQMKDKLVDMLSENARLTSGSKCGICFNGESVSHIACTHICDRSIAPRAFSHALDDITSTHADSKLRTFSRTRTWSAARSGGSWRREKCAWRRRNVLKCGASKSA